MLSATLEFHGGGKEIMYKEHFEFMAFWVGLLMGALIVLSYA
jgi:hypothetical protein